jgi:putative alpha-1,2-mannosidase
MIGNDDCGQMSAWYILSTLGFYPVNPASGTFVLGVPQVKEAKIKLQSGREFTIKAKGFTQNTIYRNSCYLNGLQISDNQISHKQIYQGGTLEFEMQKQ